MRLVRSIALMGSVPWLLLFTFALSSCASSPEARSARFIENGKNQLKNKDAQRAILEFQNALKATPGNAEAYYQLATAYLAVGDGVHAGASLRQTLRINPKHRAAELLIAKLMASTNEPSYLQEAQKRLQALLQDSPNDPDELYALALSELKLNEPADAMRDLALAKSAAPNAVMISTTLAQAKLEQKDATGAEEVLKQAIENSPKSADAVVILGRFYLAQKRLTDAERQFSRALAIDANDTGALFNLGSVQNQMGKKQEAEQTFRKLSRMPDKQFRASLAAFLSQEGRKDESLRELVRLEQEDPDDRRVRTWVINGYVAANRTPEAEKLLNSLLKKNPKDLDALLQRGELALAARNFNQAEADLNQVVRFSVLPPKCIIFWPGSISRAAKSPVPVRGLAKALTKIKPQFGRGAAGTGGRAAHRPRNGGGASGTGYSEWRPSFTKGVAGSGGASQLGSLENRRYGGDAQGYRPRAGGGKVD